MQKALKRNLCAFIFSSRRRHTRLVSDWSSDVCSSDLSRENDIESARAERGRISLRERPEPRSEERRVGKECRSGWSPHHERKRYGMPVGPRCGTGDRLHTVWVRRIVGLAVYATSLSCR